MYGLAIKADGRIVKQCGEERTSSSVCCSTGTVYSGFSGVAACARSSLELLLGSTSALGAILNSFESAIANSGGEFSPAIPRRRG
jgi:hypothetical protein